MLTVYTENCYSESVSWGWYYNRGVDKQTIFSDDYDMKRFFQSMEEFNVEKAIGNIYENSFLKKEQLGGGLGGFASKLVGSGELLNRF